MFTLAVVVYGNTLRHDFVWDDSIWLEEKIRFYRGPLDAWFEPPGLPSLRVYRPLSQLSYWLDQTLWWRNPLGFHLTSVLLHGLNGVLVLALAASLGIGVFPAAIGAALFVVHPVQTESVAWITSRVDVLATTFALLTVLLFRRTDRWWTGAAIAVAAFATASSKETGCVVPLLLAASLTAPSAAQRRQVGATTRWIGLAAAVAGVLGYLELRPASASTGIAVDRLGAADLVHLIGSFGYHVQRVLVPIGFRPYLAETPTDAGVLICAALGLVGAGWLLARRAADDRRRFAVLWILIAIALPVAVVLADFSATPVAEHRLYLATVGVAVLVATLLDDSRARAASGIGRVAVALALCLLAAVTMHRNTYWADGRTLWSAVVAYDQAHALPYLNLGLALAGEGRSADAERAYRSALDAPGTDDQTWQAVNINLGLLLLDRPSLDEAAARFSAAVAISPNAIALRGLAIVAGRRAQDAARAGNAPLAARLRAEGRELTARALQINPRYYQAYATLAGLLYDDGDYRGALDNYHRVVALAGDTATGRDAAAAAAELGAWLAAHSAGR